MPSAFNAETLCLPALSVIGCFAVDALSRSVKLIAIPS